VIDSAGVGFVQAQNAKSLFGNVFCQLARGGASDSSAELSAYCVFCST
jgi:hypothetical protein